MLGSLAHLMYGNCQTTKFHYMMQAYWMPDNLPEWVLVDDDKILEHPNNFTGIWFVWHENGVKRSEVNYLRGQPNGSLRTWHNNGELAAETYFNSKVNERLLKWFYRGGIKHMEIVFYNKNMQFATDWNEDGSLNKKEYYDDKGVFIKRELYKDNKLTKTETTE